MCALISSFTIIGVPTVVQSDNKDVYINQCIKNFSGRVGSHFVSGSSYFPQSNGRIERIHSEIDKFIKLFNFQTSIESDQNEISTDIWEIPLYLFQTKMNNTKYKGISPNDLVIGHTVNIEFDFDLNFKNFNKYSQLHRNYTKLIYHLKLNHSIEHLSNLEIKANIQNKKYLYNFYKKPRYRFNLGDKVIRYIKQRLAKQKQTSTNHQVYRITSIYNYGKNVVLKNIKTMDTIRCNSNQIIPITSNYRIVHPFFRISELITHNTSFNENYDYLDQIDPNQIKKFESLNNNKFQTINFKNVKSINSIIKSLKNLQHNISNDIIQYLN